MYWDDAFDAALSAEATVTREVLSTRDEGNVQVRRLRFTPHKELPGPIAKLIGSKKLVYEQENRWDRDKGVMSWEVIPTVLPGKLSASGTFAILPDDYGCEQVVEGEITVNVRFIGGQIEKAIVDDVVKSYENTAAFCREWLLDHAK